MNPIPSSKMDGGLSASLHRPLAMTSLCPQAQPGQPPWAPRSPRRKRLSLEQDGGDIVAVVFFQLVGGGVHLKLALFFFRKCVPRQAHYVPLPLELQGGW